MWGVALLLHAVLPVSSTARGLLLGITQYMPLVS